MSYLDHLRSFNEGKKRKQPGHTSMMEIPKEKKREYKNYLEEIHANRRSGTSKTRNNWQKILDN